jgi:hypothetical protein
MTTHSRRVALLLAALVFSVLSCAEKQATEPDGDTGPPPGSAADSIAPTVSQLVPGDGATGVPRGTVVRAVFSEPIAESTATTGTFQLEGSGAVSGTVSASGSTVTFTPDAPLEGEAVYTATLTTGIHDRAGNAMEAPRSWSFTTAGEAPVANAGPDQSVETGATVALDGTASFDPDGKPLSYTWTQAGGPDVTGGAGHLTGPEPSFTAPSAASILDFELVVSDGLASSLPDPIRIYVSETETGIFVRPDGSDSNPGTRAAPLRTVAAAILAAAAGAGDVHVARGTYTQDEFVLLSGVSLYGGYDDQFQNRDPGAYPTILSGGVTAMTASAGVSGVRVDGITVRSASATTPGGSSVAVLLRGADHVSFQGCVIEAGSGVRGADGGPGQDGAQGAAGSEGQDGDCEDPTRPGAGGPGGGEDSFAGGPGGAGGALASGFIGESGGSGAGAGGGDGGDGGLPTSRGRNGDDGQPGGEGAPGSNGAGGAQFGAMSGAGYAPSPGLDGGGDGTRGSGGGGGGGSSGILTQEDQGAGNGGGGGGGGGAPGSGGSGGAGGGGSFGVVLIGATDVVIQSCTIRTGQGGAGGTGGGGGDGGPGGEGAAGGNACQSTIGRGGRGGSGGVGGSGGHGGGGGGGPAIGIVWDVASTLTEAGNGYTLGSAGPGGASPGSAGSAGARQDVLRTGGSPAPTLSRGR